MPPGIPVPPLVALEGIDEALLQAQAERICHWLRDLEIAAEQTLEPTQGPVGAQIRLVQQGRLQLPSTSVALLEVADRLDHLACPGGIMAWLAERRVVVCVHYALSSYASHWRQLDWTWLRQINARCRPPDLTLFIDTPAPAGAPAEEPSHAYHAAIAALQAEGEPIVVIDGRGSEEDILSACQAQLLPLLSRFPPRPGNGGGAGVGDIGHATQSGAGSFHRL
jgi:dTMP kinase